MRGLAIALMLVALPAGAMMSAVATPDGQQPSAPQPTTANPGPVAAPASDEPLPDPRLEAEAQDLSRTIGGGSPDTRREIRSRLARGETPKMIGDALGAPAAAASPLAATPRPAPTRVRPAVIIAVVFMIAAGLAAAIVFGRRRPRDGSARR